MTVEVCSYRLSVRGKPVGMQVLRTERGKRFVTLEAHISLRGGLGQHTVTQRSQLQAEDLSSLRFSEQTVSRNEKRDFEVLFDRNLGLVKASRGPRDRAEIPYTRDFQDPLGLLYQLRALDAEADTFTVPMLGKDVTIQRLGKKELDTVFGPRPAQVFTLHPGDNVVYVDAEAPHTILKFEQSVDGQVLEALLMKVAEEEAMPKKSEPRRRKRRRRRRKRNKDN